jgi:DNA-binding NtrC family response regulator
MQEKLFSVLLLQSRQDAEELGSIPVPLGDGRYWVDTAQHIEEANALLDQRTYDMFFMDISDTSIGECLNLINRVRDLETDLIMISDHVDGKWHQKAMNIGVSTIVTKPINPTLLQEMVKKHKKIRGFSDSD